MALMGEPQRAAPVIHLTGTNGKGSTAQIATRLLAAQGLTVGTYTSPHLERVNERISRNGEPIPDDELVEVIASVAALEPLMDEPPTYFEILTAAAYRWFADVAVDAMVVEVGLLGRWDATNVADGSVAVVTNVGLDHTEYAGPSLLDIAREKAGIVKPGATLVLGETDPDVADVFRAEGAAALWEREVDFTCIENNLAVGGRMLDIRTPGAVYSELFLPLHGAHQGDNAAAALTAVEAFFGGAPLEPELVQQAFDDVVMPGRFEVVHRQPLVVLDGAHNVPGAEVLRGVLDDDFTTEGERLLVVGFLQGRDPEDMLDALGVDDVRLVVACTPPSPRAVPAREVADAAERLGATATVVPDVARAVRRALDEAEMEDVVLVTGSLYVVGAARMQLVRQRL